MKVKKGRDHRGEGGRGPLPRRSLESGTSSSVPSAPCPGGASLTSTCSFVPPGKINEGGEETGGKDELLECDGT